MVMEVMIRIKDIMVIQIVIMMNRKILPFRYYGREIHNTQTRLKQN